MHAHVLVSKSLRRLESLRSRFRSGRGSGNGEGDFCCVDGKGDECIGCGMFCIACNNSVLRFIMEVFMALISTSICLKLLLHVHVQA